MATGLNSTVGKRNPQPTGGSHSVAKRLQSELMGLMMTPEAGVSAFPEGESLFRWVGTIEGPVNSVYEGLSYKLCLEFSPDYPYKPPKVTFTTACYHPNVDGSGRICLDILRDQWSALLDVRTILISIRSLLSEPNVSSPMNVQAADLWSDQEQFKKTLLEKYEREVRMAEKAAK